MKKILVIIPARSGSKGIKDKNIINFNGKPLLSWSIKQAKMSKYFSQMKIIVSTDSEKYQRIAKDYGAEVPFLRPNNISGDFSSDYECFLHCFEWLKKNENYNADIILHLRPTQPLRTIKLIDECISIFLDNFDNYDSLRTVIPQKKSPCKMYSISSNNLIPLVKEWKELKEPYNKGRQELPQFYLHNGYVDLLKTSILVDGTISGNKIYPFIMNESDNVDIDEMDNLKKI